jgi:hypothetical protein
MKQILVFATLFAISFALVSNHLEHTAIMRANIVTAERDITELEKRIRINEERERTLNNQLRIHYRDLRVAANPTARVQLERGIESILSELRVLRAATRKFTSKMREIANGIVGIERNELIRRLRVERRLGTEPKPKLEKAQRKAEKQVKKIAKKTAKQYGRIAAQHAAEKAGKEAYKKFGDDKEKIKMEQKKAAKQVYKKAYNAIMAQIKTATYGLPLKQIKNKAADTVLTMTRRDNIAVKMSPKKQEQSVQKAIKKVIKNPLPMKSKAVDPIPPEKQKSPEEIKQKEKVKEAQKAINKQKDQIKRQEIKMQKQLEKEKLNKGSMVAKKPALPKMNKVKLHKRQIERVAYKAEVGAKKIGLKPLKPQVVQKVEQQPASITVSKEIQQMESEQKTKLQQLEALRRKGPQIPEFAPPMPQNAPMAPIMNMEAQREYLTSLYGRMPPYMANNYFVEPNELNAAYNELLM